MSLQTYQWSAWRIDEVPDIDDFAHHFDHESGNLWIFGGYYNGKKSNVLLKIDVANRIVEEVVPDQTPTKSRNAKMVPKQRTGARIVKVKNYFYLFGGLTITNETMNDMWKIKIGEFEWQNVEQKGRIPSARCGHSLNVHTDKIFLFGGLKEVTKESNECFKFDTITETWEEVGQSSHETQLKYYDSFGNSKHQSDDTI